MKSLTFIAFLGIITLAACSNKEKAGELTTNDQKAQKELHDPSQVNANATAKLEVDGMMCVMGCGSEIRKHLYQTEAVKSVEFDFIDGRTTNFATVSFNAEKINKKELIEVIKNIEGSDFDARAGLSEPVKIEEESSEKENEDVLMKVETKNFALPNLSNMLRSLFF